MTNKNARQCAHNFNIKFIYSASPIYFNPPSNTLACHTVTRAPRRGKNHE